MTAGRRGGRAARPGRPAGRRGHPRAGPSARWPRGSTCGPYATDDTRPLGGQRPDARAWTGCRSGSAPTTCSASARPRRRWPSSPCASPSAAPSTSAPAAASRRCTWPRTAATVVATDVNQRALGITRFNAALNEVGDRVEVRDGSFFEPVRGERFDLIATNPPFVISPGDRRAAGLPRLGAARRPGRRAHRPRRARTTSPSGGWCQVLANWVVDRDRPWDERLASWLAPDDATRSSCSARWSTPRRTSSCGSRTPGSTGDRRRPRTTARRYDTWLSWFEEQGIEAVGFGWVNLRAGGDRPARPSGSGRTTSSSRSRPRSPAGRDGAGRRRRRADARLVLRADVRQETVGAAGAEDPETIVLRQQRGLRRARQADTVERRPGRGLRRRPGVGLDPRRPRPAARPRSGRDAGDVPPGRARAGRRGVPRQRAGVMSVCTARP